MVFARFGFSWNFRLSYPRLRQALSRYLQFHKKGGYKTRKNFNNLDMITFLASETPSWVTAFSSGIAVFIILGIKSLFSKKKND